MLNALDRPPPPHVPNHMKENPATCACGTDTHAPGACPRCGAPWPAVPRPRPRARQWRTRMIAVSARTPGTGAGAQGSFPFDPTLARPRTTRSVPSPRSGAAAAAPRNPSPTAGRAYGQPRPAELRQQQREHVEEAAATTASSSRRRVRGEPRSGLCFGAWGAGEDEVSWPMFFCRASVGVGAWESGTVGSRFKLLISAVASVVGVLWVVDLEGSHWLEKILITVEVSSENN